MQGLHICRQCNKGFVPKRKYKKTIFCSILCFHKSRRGVPTWNKGVTGYLSEEARKAMSENAKKNINKETKVQREKRMQSMLKSRNKNGLWVSPKLGKIGEQDSMWLGNDASYNAKHRWIQKHWKKTNICSHCLIKAVPFGRRKYGTEWANISGLYDRDDKADWVELCVACHRKFDKK